MDSRTNIHCLPDDALVKIFSYLTLYELFQVQRVSTQWKRIVQYTDVWRNLVYNPDYKVTDGQIINVLQQAPKLQSLFLVERSVHTTVLQTLIQNCFNLKKVAFNRDQKMSSRFLRDLVSNCSNIEFLHLPDGVLTRFKHAEILGQFPKLKTIVAGFYTDCYNPAQVIPLADGCPALQELALQNAKHIHDDMSYLLHKKRDQLQRLFVSWISADGKCTIPLLRTCSVLHSLIMENYRQSDIIAPHFQIIKDMKTITSLTFVRLNNAELDNLISLFDEKAMDQLIELRVLKYNAYKDELAKVVVDNCPLLTFLQFEDCANLTDRSVENLYTLKLKNLNLSMSSITDYGMTSISKCRDLTHLNLSRCRELKTSAMRQMIKFPKLQVLKLHNCDLKGLQFHRFTTHLKGLRLLDIRSCINLNLEEVTQLKMKVPHLIVEGVN